MSLDSEKKISKTIRWPKDIMNYAENKAKIEHRDLSNSFIHLVKLGIRYEKDKRSNSQD
jgi:hypothetical protein